MKQDWLVKGTARINIHQVVKASSEAEAIKTARRQGNWWMDDDPQLQDIHPYEAELDEWLEL